MDELLAGWAALGSIADERSPRAVAARAAIDALDAPEPNALCTYFVDGSRADRVSELGRGLVAAFRLPTTLKSAERLKACHDLGVEGIASLCTWFVLGSAHPLCADPRYKPLCQAAERPSLDFSIAEPPPDFDVAVSAMLAERKGSSLDCGTARNDETRQTCLAVRARDASLCPSWRPVSRPPSALTSPASDRVRGLDLALTAQPDRRGRQVLVAFLGDLPVECSVLATRDGTETVLGTFVARASGRRVVRQAVAAEVPAGAGVRASCRPTGRK
jgi:hypothetical protein